MAWAVIDRIALAGAVVLTIGGCSHAPLHETSPGARLVPAGDCARVESGRFDFRVDPWINLHHFLFQWARATTTPGRGDTRPPAEVPETAQLGGLAEGEREAWNRAVSYYRERLIGGPLLFDRSLITLRASLGALACAPTVPAAVDPELWSLLAGAMPVYRGHWWEGHRAADAAWVEERMTDLRAYENPLARRLADAYGGEWPDERVRVDVAAYSNWAGAYTTNDPNQLTISSRDYTGLEGLEILFHEVSHASFFEQRLLGEVAAAFRARGTRPPDRLVHVVQFVTPAVLLREVVGRDRLAGYRSIAERLYAKGPSADQYRVVVREWTPFLEGRESRRQALERIAATLSPPGRGGGARPTTRTRSPATPTRHPAPGPHVALGGGNAMEPGLP